MNYLNPQTNEVTLTIPLTISIKVGQPIENRIPSTDIEVSSAFERARPVNYYDGYVGYKSDFLDFEVKLPELTAEQKRNAAKNSVAKNDEDPSVLPYTNFSVVMNRRRQLAYYTAVNIDGARSIRPTRDGDAWFYDARIAESEQIGEELYKRNALDRGHLVRRLDPVWGSNADRANDDTFHFTNCSPQHERFNQNNETWLGLEDFILNFADQKNRKLTVFTGPVLSGDDPLYKGVRLPLAFWKIVVFTKKTGEPGAGAFLLDQSKLIETLPGLEARFEPGAYRITLAELKNMTELDFSYLEAYETPLSDNRLERAGAVRVALEEDYSNITL
ncbi:DNA/RNA non-specific endonuclease [Dyadobacter sp. LJ53]|uniref:DNA/RNA non-specific endonuclease n=1 Tax=Dyadobacter chenwenxiniae TaxID=2906456 RepID=UPI001F3DD2FA|nr:DNA/RNA non-specific endonuclease [Dyadobacter chenwenxiniae]MCF0049554.1 DNA/RNA non-specific endonuclease [Dyadobacter chenwenxiniae]